MSNETTDKTDLFGGIKYSAETEYRTILERAGKPLPSDFQRIKELVGDMGITLEVAKRDLQTVKRIKELEPIVAELEKRTAEHTDSRAKLNATKQKYDALLTEQMRALQAAIALEGKAQKAWEKVMDAKGELNELRKHKRLFGK